MTRRLSIIVAGVWLVAASGWSKPPEGDNNQGRHSVWLGFGRKGPSSASVQPTVIPGPAYTPQPDGGSGAVPPGAVVMPYGSAAYGHPPEPIMATPASTRKSLYPGLSSNARHSPRMASPYDGSGPATATPVYGETRGQYELRMKALQGKQLSSDPNTPKRRTLPSNDEGGNYQNTPPAGYPGVPVMENAPAQNNVHSRLSEIYADRANGTAPEPVTIGKVRSDFEKTRSTLQRALEKGDYDTLSREARGLQKRIDTIKDSSADIALEDKLNLMNMSHLAAEASQSIFEGSSSQQDEMIQMGLQNLDKAIQGLTDGGPASKSNK